MKNILLLFAVILTFTESPQPIGCPSPPPEIYKNKDGTYSRRSNIATTLGICYSNGRTWQEEWTDYPEKGGKFIRKPEVK